MSLWSTIIELFANSASGKKSEPPLIKSGTPINSNEIIEEASKWIGLDEKSPGVNVFRMAADQKADGEAWCAAFVIYCARAVALRHGREPSIHLSELCYEMWQKSPKECRLSLPEPGCIIVWNTPGTLRGHTGIVEKVLPDSVIITIEGNTSGGKDEPHGVHRRSRAVAGTPGLHVLGFLKPFI